MLTTVLCCPLLPGQASLVGRAVCTGLFLWTMVLDQVVPESRRKKLSSVLLLSLKGVLVATFLMKGDDRDRDSASLTQDLAPLRVPNDA